MRASVEDAAAADDWVVRNIAAHGGDLKRIYLSGHSAGGHLAAWVATDPRFAGGLKGVIAMSGVYDVARSRHSRATQPTLRRFIELLPACRRF